MKNIILLLFISNFIWSQEQSKPTTAGINLVNEIQLGATTSLFIGNNYLAKGHFKPNIGFNISINVLQFNNFKLGGSYERISLKVSDYSIGGNIEKTNMITATVNLLYNFNVSKKLLVSPQLKYGASGLNQKNGSKSYGSQNGNTIGISMNFNYKFDKTISIFSNIGYNHYTFTTNTTNEFQNYFDNSNSLNLTLGIQLF